MRNSAQRDPDRWRNALRDEQPEARVARMWREIRTRQEASEVRAGRGAQGWLARSVVPLAALGILLLTAVAVLLTSIGLRVTSVSEEPATLLLHGAPLPLRLAPDHTHVFSDASELTTDASAAVDVLESKPRSVVLALRRGSATFRVTPGGPRTWKVVCGEVTVEVVGTVFRVDRQDGIVEVAVARGSVLVRGAAVPDGVQRLDTGGRISVRTRSGEPSTTEESATVLADEPQPVTASESAAAQPANTPRAEAGRDAVETLLARADALRLAGRPHEAVRSLEAIIAGHSKDGRAALAAYSLARLRLEVLAQPARAARNFQQSLNLGLSGPLVEAAEAGRVVALGQAGQSDRAAALAETYLRAYPRGRYRDEVQQWR